MPGGGTATLWPLCGSEAHQALPSNGEPPHGASLLRLDVLLDVFVLLFGLLLQAVGVLSQPLRVPCIRVLVLGEIACVLGFL